MEVMLADQTRAFLYAALLGAGLGLLYDLLRTIRILLGNGKWLTAGLDLFYCLAAALSFFTLTLLYGQGQVRSYTVAGAVLGAVLYFSGFSHLVLAVLAPVARFFHGLPGRMGKIGQKALQKTRKK